MPPVREITGIRPCDTPVRARVKVDGESVGIALHEVTDWRTFPNWADVLGRASVGEALAGLVGNAGDPDRWRALDRALECPGLFADAPTHLSAEDDVVAVAVIDNTAPVTEDATSALYPYVVLLVVVALRLGSTWMPSYDGEVRRALLDLLEGRSSSPRREAVREALAGTPVSVAGVRPVVAVQVGAGGVTVGRGPATARTERAPTPDIHRFPGPLDL